MITFEEEWIPTTEDEVFEVLWFRITHTDEEWEAESCAWELTREEAANRLSDEDYSIPEP